MPFHGRSSYEERFCGKTSRINCHSSKRSENVLFSFLLPKTTKNYGLGKIFAELSVILRLQKRELNFWETIIVIFVIIIIVIVIIIII